MSRRKKNKLIVVESPKFHQYVDRATELIHKGWRSNEIYADIVSVWPEHNHFYHKELMDRAYLNIRNTLHKDRQYIFQLHMTRYEDLFRQSMIMEDNANRLLDPKKDWQTIIYKLQTALKVLKNKEDLVGLHNKDVVIEIENNNTTIISEKSEGAIQLTNLSLNEKIELLSLLRETRTIPIEGERQVIIKKRTLDENNEIVSDKRTITATDAQYEEMPDSVVDKMVEDFGKPKIMYIEAPLIEDYVDRSKKPKTLKQVQESIDGNIKDKFEKLMKRTAKK